MTPAVIPINKPYILLPGLRMTAINPPNPVPRLATRLSNTILTNGGISEIMMEVRCSFLVTF